jgi:RNA polymerase sigma-70 factor (sigma-E family)
VNTVVNGESTEAVLDGPTTDPPALADDPGLDATVVDVLGPQADATVVDVLSPQITIREGQQGSPVLDGQGAAILDGADDSSPDVVKSLPTVHGEPSDTVARPTGVTETLAASAIVPEVRPAPSVWDADRVVTEIYHGEYKSLVRLAVLLVHDVPTAEEVVQDAFEAMHTAWRRLRDSEKALSYLRQAVVNKSRSVLRHRTVVDKNAPKPAPDEPSAEQGALALIERSAVVAALRTLPDRQREAIVLRYYADLSEADIAATMGISRGAVKSHTARAMAALKSILEQETS